jgi:phosphoribosylformimino-5-aminoimidazole carboxamide ribotide isomerase
MTDDLRARLLPVLDLKGGHVVRGAGGRREEYRPIVSKWVDSSDPLRVAVALRQRCGFQHFYVADLGAICDRIPHRSEVASLLRAGFELDLDAGVRTPADCEPILEFPGVRIVLGLETIASPLILRQVAARLPPSRLVFSLDLKAGAPIATPHWPDSPIQIASTVLDSGIRTLIVLDLTSVGCEAGCPTLPLCREIRARFPDVELITGGGIRDELDVRRAIDSGVDRVLVASALHSGRLL